MKTLLAAIVVSLALSACSNNDKNSSLIFEELNESLERSNNSIRRSTMKVFEDLTAKSKRPECGERASYWLEKANLIHEITYKSCDSIKAMTKINNYKNGNGSSEFEDLIHDVLKQYYDYVLQIDPMINKQFSKKIDFLIRSLSFPIQKNRQSLFVNEITNDVINVENWLVSFCKDQVGATDGEGFYRVFQAIAGVNSSKLQIGDELIVTAGVGAFNTAAKPDIIIGGKKIPLNENGVAEYKIKVGKKTGRQRIHVKISYTATDGVRDSLEKDIEYLVVE